MFSCFHVFMFSSCASCSHILCRKYSRSGSLANISHGASGLLFWPLTVKSSSILQQASIRGQVPDTLGMLYCVRRKGEFCEVWTMYNSSQRLMVGSRIKLLDWLIYWLKNVSCAVAILNISTKLNAIMFTVISIIKWTKFRPSSDIIFKVSLFRYVIYSSADAHCWQCVPAGEKIT